MTDQEATTQSAVAARLSVQFNAVLTFFTPFYESEPATRIMALLYVICSNDVSCRKPSTMPSQSRASLHSLLDAVLTHVEKTAAKDS